MTTKQYRLVTRSDFDGLVCAVLLKHLDMVSDIKFVHPKDMQDGKIEIDDNDITTNLPFVPGVYLAFDHHHSETVRNGIRENHIIDPEAPSAARVVFDHYGGFGVFPESWDEMMAAVDKADSAQYVREDIVNPKNWELLNFIMDARTGLGRFREFRISNYELMMQLIDYCASHSIEEILQLEDVKERVDMYKEHHLLFMDQIKQNTEVHKNVVVLNLQEQDPIWAGNRFMIYALFPEINISIHRMWGLKKQNTVFAVGKSILDRSSKTNVGELMLKYGGGGHLAAGTCQVENDKAEEVLAELIETMNADG
ncbi:exopolyphosphatase [uncultured Pseudoteredinibacter sp.]|uniref:exopolyphosphatase n=1 Tax=uncultured Pseudoteredinibacter sp. TaxID=1641701 RepID=UPI0026123603|nr:exopolyphosphatase [uncultured Pseudoteredinibacter sp.]